MIYPFKFFTGVYMDGILIVIFYLLWTSILKHNGLSSVDGYDTQKLLTYYAIAFTFDKLLAGRQLAREISSLVASGKIASHIIQPVNFFGKMYAKMATTMLLRSMVPFVLIITISLFVPQVFVQPKNLIFFALAVVLGSLINYLLALILGSLSFYTAKIWGIITMAGAITDILNGTLVPLDLMPETIRKISYILPFLYTKFAPINIYLNQSSNPITTIGKQILWIGILALISTVIWKRGLRRYEAYGN